MNTNKRTKQELEQQIERLQLRIKTLEKNALFGSEECFQIICEHGGIGIASGDLQGCMTFVNPALEKMLGYNKEELIDRNFRDFTLDKDLPTEEAFIKELLAGKRDHYSIEKRYLRKDGELIWVMLSASFMRDSEGKPARTIAMLQDITERKLVQEALAASEERYRRIVETAEEGIATHGPDGTVTYVNQRMADMLGYSCEEIIGRSSLDFVEDEEKEEVTRAHESLKEQGGFIKERKLRRKDGSTLWTLIHVSPQRDASGSFSGYLAMHTDITERKRTEEKLLESERNARRRAEELTALMGMIPAAVWVSQDRSCGTITGNIAAQKFYEADKDENLSAGAIGGAQDLTRRFFQNGRELKPEELPMQMAAAKGIDIRDSEIEVLLPSGKKIAILGNASPLLDECGQVRGSIAACIDITERKRAEEALRAVEREKALILDSTNEIIAYHDTEHNFIWANKAYLDSLGMSLSELKGKKCYRCWGLDRLCIDCPVTTAIQTCQPQEGEITPENQTHWPSDRGSWIVRAAPVKDSTGKVIGAIEMAHDITGRKRSEEALKQRDAVLEAFFEASPGILNIVDENLRYIKTDKLTPTYFGLDRQTIVGKAGEDLVPDFIRDHGAMMKQVIETGRPELNLEVKSPMPSRPGEITYWRASYFPVPLLEKKQGLGIIGLEITDIKKAEETLRDSEERLRSLAENVPCVLMRFDRQFRIVYLNSQNNRYNAISVESLLGRTNREAGMPEKLCDQWEAAIERVFCTGSQEEMEFEFAGPSGMRWFALRFAPEFGPDHDVRYVLGVSSDITERKQAEENLRRAKEELETRVQERTKELALRARQLRALAGELTISEQRERKRLASLLHDHLQQLLVGAKFRLTILGNKVEDDGINQATREIEELIDESIKSSRSLTAELSPPILHDAGLNAGLEWLGRRMADTQGLLVALKITQIDSLPEDLTILLFEAVRELLFNVAKHAKTSSASIKVERIEDILKIAVSDNGIGFDPAALPPAGEAGRGFGIFSLRERVELFGGSLEIDSAPGRGSRFVIAMPLTHIQSKPEEKSELPKEIIPKLIPKSYSGRKIRVVLADDHAVVRQGIANLLEDEWDMEVVGTAADGQEAVKLAAKLLPDVILMDMNMPKLNGVEATRLIHAELSEIRIIGLSMFEEAEKARAMRDAGAVNYLTKSGPAEELIVAIRKAVGRPQKEFTAQD
jgi:PAS domain S-box-containing protein